MSKIIGDRTYCPFSETQEFFLSQWLLQSKFLLPSIVILATANEPQKTEKNKMDRNLPITTDKLDLLTRLK